MKFQTALKLCLVGATASWREILAQETQDRRRTMKEQAIGFVHRFLKSIQSNHKKPQGETTLVAWDGYHLVPQKKIEHSPITTGASSEESERENPHQGRLRANSRRSRNLRNTKTERKSAKTSKSTKSSKDNGFLDDLGVSTKTFKGESGEEFMCFEGSFEDVEMACQIMDANCCTYPYACRWFGDATVCQGSCRDRNSCRDIASGSMIGPDSCVGEYACASMAVSSDREDSVTIGQNSCQGYKTCFQMCAASDSCKIDIGNNACSTGDMACYKMGFNARSIEIGEKSCVGSTACSSLGEVRMGRIEIKDGSCDGLSACEGLGKYAPGVVFIGDNSCDADLACVFIGSRSTLFKTINIVSEACRADQACYYLGVYSAKGIQIEKGSCQAKSSCLGVGRYTSGTVIVEENACTYSYGCSGVFQFFYRPFVRRNVRIGRNACNDRPDQCSTRTDVRCKTTSFIPKNADSCTMN